MVQIMRLPEKKSLVSCSIPNSETRHEGEKILRKNALLCHGDVGFETLSDEDFATETV